MTLVQQVCARAKLMVQELTQENQVLLEDVCMAAVSSLKQRLLDNIGAEDCHTDFVTAAAMLAVAAMWEMGAISQVEQFTAGDVTVRTTSKENAVFAMRAQAMTLMQPYMKAGYVFMGV